MNPEAGFIQGPFRDRVERIARAHPKMPADEVICRARSDEPAPPLPAKRSRVEATPEFEF